MEYDIYYLLLIIFNKERKIKTKKKELEIRPYIQEIKLILHDFLHFKLDFLDY